MARDNERLSETIEDYLQTIYSLDTEGETVISARLARWMRVSPPTAWATVQRMARDGMVDVDDKAIHLTPSGRELAEDVARRHRLELLNDVWLRLGGRAPEAHHFERRMTRGRARMWSDEQPQDDARTGPIPGRGQPWTHRGGMDASK
jgi:DtxR family Mn-dependent transcriptional regulator